MVRWLLRFAGRFILLRWLCVRWLSSPSRLRLQQGLTTAQGVTPARITPAIVPAPSHHRHRHYRHVIALGADAGGVLPSCKPTSLRTLPPATPLPTADLPRTWPPKRVVTGTSRAHRGGSAAWQDAGAGFADTQASVESNATPAATAAPGSFGSSNIVAEARRYIGGNPTGMGRLWCARFMNLVLKHSGYHGTGSDRRVRSQATAGACRDRRSAPSR